MLHCLQARCAVCGCAQGRVHHYVWGLSTKGWGPCRCLKQQCTFLLTSMPGQLWTAGECPHACDRLCSLSGTRRWMRCALGLAGLTEAMTGGCVSRVRVCMYVQMHCHVFVCLLVDVCMHARVEDLRLAPHPCKLCHIAPYPKSTVADITCGNAMRKQGNCILHY